MILNSEKKFESIDGLFKEKLNVEYFNKEKKLKSKVYSIYGKGNSISSIPFNKKSILIKDISKNVIKINKKKLEVTVGGNLEIYKIHNELLKNSFFLSCFPSYPNVSIGACVANAVHGLNPKSGCISKYVKKIKIYNPNLGIKTLTKNLNYDLYNLTIGGMGLTGLILEVTMSCHKLKSSLFITKTRKFNCLYEGYSFLKKSNFLYNQNNFFINNSSLNFAEGIITSGNFYKKFKIQKEVKGKKINNLRLGIMKSFLFRNLLKKILVFTKVNNQKKLIHINEILYPSNQRLLYFNFLNKKFIEHQIIIPHKYVRLYFQEFKKIVIKNKPIISLCHMKIFSGKPKYLQFDGNGLGLSIHLLINKNFYPFYNELQKLDLKYNCRINLYKNSFINLKVIKKNYPQVYRKFIYKIKKINKKIFFTNNIFSKNIYND